MKSFLRFLLVALLACVALTAIAIPFVLPVLPFMQASERHPTDEAMIAHWRGKRAVFEQLTAMLKDDPALKRLAQDWVQPQDTGITAERIALYRKLMKDAGIVSLSNYGNEMKFLFHASGWSIAGSGKSFVFGDPSSYAEQIDGDLETASQGERKGTWQRPLEGRWRLEFDKS